MPNVHLLYALMHDYDIISVHFTHPLVDIVLKGTSSTTTDSTGDSLLSPSSSSLGKEIAELTQYYLTKIERFVGESNKYCNAQQVRLVIVIIIIISTLTFTLTSTSPVTIYLTITATSNIKTIF